MPFDVNKLRNNPISSLQDATDALAGMGIETTREILAQVNLLLELLQSAGYGIGSLEIELSLPPKITIKLKTGLGVKEEKLSAILREHVDKKVLIAIVALLIQANKLRDSITVETLEFEEVQIIMTTTPNITLQWKDKEDLKAEAAARG